MANKRVTKKLKSRLVVGMAIVESRYGGPEEGGWDYEVGRPVMPHLTKMFTSSDKAYVYARKLNDRLEAGERFRGVGVGGCGDMDDFCRGEFTGNDGLEAKVQYAADDRLGVRRLKPWPDHRPHYE